MTVEVTLRPAEATDSDGISFAGYLEQASDGLFRLMLGRRVHRILASSFVIGGHDLSFEHVTIAEVDGRPVGMLSAYTGESHHEASDSVLESAAGWRRVRMGVITVLAHGLLTFMDTIEKDTFYVQAIAVDPSSRGQGIGTRLLEHAERVALEAGSVRLALDVAEDNHQARRLYERLGYTKVAASPRVLWLNNTRVVRMTRPIEQNGLDEEGS